MSAPPVDLRQQIAERLRVLAPDTIDVEDESALHAGHPGAAGGGGHFRITVISAAFTGQSRLARHRLVYAALGDLMQARIHALALDTRAPGEAAASGSTAAPTDHL